MYHRKTLTKTTDRNIWISTEITRVCPFFFFFLFQIRDRVVPDSGNASMSGRSSPKLFTVVVLFRDVWVWNLKIFKATSHESSEGDGNAEDSVLDETTEDYWAGSGSGPEDDDSIHNETREALTHEASDHDAVSRVPELRSGSRSRRVGSIMHVHLANCSPSSNHVPPFPQFIFALLKIPAAF